MFITFIHLTGVLKLKINKILNSTILYYGENIPQQVNWFQKKIFLPIITNDASIRNNFQSMYKVSFWGILWIIQRIKSYIAYEDVIFNGK